MISTGLIARFGQKYTVTRAKRRSQYENGEFEAGATETLEIVASVQPAGPEDIVQDPGGDRTKVRYRVYTASKLFNIQSSPLKQADLIEIDCETFLVESIEKWPGHYKAIVVRLNEEDSE